jgi:hypothetical protein
MRPSLLRSFFLLAYERIGAILVLSTLRAAPWLLLVLFVTFVPLGQTPSVLFWGGAGALLLLALVAAPWSHALALRFAGALARGAESSLRALVADRRHYAPLLAWTLGELLLALLLLPVLLRVLEPDAGPRPLGDWLAFSGGLWLWVLSRVWGFVFLPLLVLRERGAAHAARLALWLLLGSPRRLLPAFLGRQLLALLLAISGLGLLLGLGGLLPLHACFWLREALRPLGLELGPPGAGEANRPLDPVSSLRRVWRPWE